MTLTDGVIVSVIIPTLQRAALLQEALSSLLVQTLPSWEAIVVDDGSTDDSEAVVRGFSRQHPGVRWIRREGRPPGAPACRNLGAESSSGEYLVFLDSDDLLAPYCLEQRAEYLRDTNELAYAVFPMLLFGKTPLDRPELWNVIQKGDCRPEEALRRFLGRDLPWQTTMPIWRRAAFVRTGGWDEQVSNWQDWEFHVRALLGRLSYRVVAAAPDCFLRRGVQERISEDDVAVEAVWNKAATFRKVLAAVRRSELWSERLAGDCVRLLLHYAERMALLDAPWPLVQALLLPIREHNLLGRREYRWIRAYLRFQKLVASTRVPLVAGGLYRFVRLRTNPYFSPVESGLHQHRLSERALLALRAATNARARPMGTLDWEAELMETVPEAARV